MTTYPPVVDLEPMQHSQRVVSPQYGHAHLQSSIGQPQFGHNSSDKYEVLHNQSTIPTVKCFANKEKSIMQLVEEAV
jgi:hypothetical protein